MRMLARLSSRYSQIFFCNTEKLVLVSEFIFHCVESLRLHSTHSFRLLVIYKGILGPSQNILN